MNLRYFSFFVLIFAITASISIGAPGDLDTTFNGTGKLIVPLSLNGDSIDDMVVQPDGKMVVVGTVELQGFRFLVARFNPNGTLDTDFGTGGIVANSFGYAFASGTAVTLQADGKIVVGGYGVPGVGDSKLIVARFLTNGTLDTTFNHDGVAQPLSGFGGIVRSLAVQADNKIIVCGTASFGFGFGSAFIIRYTPDGTPDRRFGHRGRVTISDSVDAYGAHAVRVQPDQKLVVMGNYGFSQDNSTYVVRLHPHGKFDASFDSDGRQNISFATGLNLMFDFEIQPDGKIVVGGHYAPTEASGSVWAMARLNPNGAFDTSFDGDGKLTITAVAFQEFAMDLAIQVDGKIVMSGSLRGSLDPASSSFLLMRRNSDGSPDLGFGQLGRVETQMASGYDAISTLKIQGDGKILAAGSADSHCAFARYLGP